MSDEPWTLDERRYIGLVRGEIEPETNDEAMYVTYASLLHAGLIAPEQDVADMIHAVMCAVWPRLSEAVREQFLPYPPGTTMVVTERVP